MNSSPSKMNAALLFLVLPALLTAESIVKRQAAGDQNPKVWDALRTLRGGRDLTVEDQFSLIANAVPGRDYPTNAFVPPNNVDCSDYRQPGYYVDTTNPSRCQAFHRCDNNGLRTDYLCPNGTLFNQIALICDWFFNIDCPASAQFRDYSNSRLGLDLPFLDDQLEINDATAPAGVRAALPVAAGRPVAVARTTTTTTTTTTAPPTTARTTTRQGIRAGGAAASAAGALANTRTG